MDVDKISLAISLLSFLFSGYVFFKNHLYSSAVNQLSVRKSINDCYSDILKKQVDCTILNDKDEISDALHAELESAILSYINTFDEVCSLYIDFKLHRKRFLLTYKREIKDIFSNPMFNEFISDESEYPNLRKVYYRLCK